MSVSVDYNIFAWCCGISIYKNWKKICTDVNTGIFPIPIAYWSGFEISKQNRGNPGEIGMVEQSDCPWFVVRKCITLQAPRSLARDRRRWQLPNTQIHNNFLLWKFLEIAAMTSKCSKRATSLSEWFHRKVETFWRYFCRSTKEYEQRKIVGYLSIYLLFLTITLNNIPHFRWSFLENTVKFRK